MTDPIPSPSRTSPGDPASVAPLSAPGLIPTAPVAPGPRAPVGPAKASTRWLVAGGLTALVAVAVIALAVFASQRASSVGSVGPRYLPATTLVYLDARLDLPGDQGQQVAGFLSRFPGFADQSALPAKLEDIMTRLVHAASNGKVDYDSQVKTWFGGQVVVALTHLPSGPSSDTTAGSLALFSVTDEAAARTALDAIVKETGTSVTSTEVYRDVSIQVLDGPSGSSGGALAVTPDMLLVGRSAADLKAALDLHAGTGASLAGSSTFTAALAGLRSDRLGTLFVDVPGLTKAAEATAAAAGPAASILGTLPQPVGAVAGEVHAEGNRLVASFRAAKGPDAPSLSARTSDLAGHVPSGAVVYVETHDTGQLLHDAIAGIETSPAFKAQAGGAQLQALEGLLGGDPKDLLGWVKDAAAVVTLRADGTPQGGIVALAGDAGTGQARVSQWLGLFKLAALQSGGALSTTQEQASGTTITVVHVETGQLAGSIAAPATIDLAVASRDDLFVVGLGDAFVKQVLALSPADSLAQLGRYQDALKSAGGPSDSGVLWLDVAGLKDHLAAAVPSSDRARFDADVAPYLALLDHVIGVQSVDGSTITGVIQLATK
ncbi:MAG: DUF3352 domain-containing protein [Candidatus Limnocylindrales bacterium]